MHRGVRFLFENSIMNVFTPEQLKERIDDNGNSIAWLMWHLARSEDMVVNLMIRGEPQMLFEGDWNERLGIDADHIGTGLQDDEVGELTKEMNVEAVDEYWKALTKTSFAWLKSIENSDVLDEVPDIDERLRSAPPIVAGGANDAALQFWKGRSSGDLFTGIVIGHGYIHVGQMQEIGGRLGKRGWF